MSSLALRTWTSRECTFASSSDLFDDLNFICDFEEKNTMHFLKYRLTGAFHGNGGPFQVEGFVDGSIVGMTVALTAEFATTDDGLMRVQVETPFFFHVISGNLAANFLQFSSKQVPNCSTIISRSHFNINPQGPMGPVVKTLEVVFYALFCSGF